MGAKTATGKWVNGEKNDPEIPSQNKQNGKRDSEMMAKGWKGTGNMARKRAHRSGGESDRKGRRGRLEGQWMV